MKTGSKINIEFLREGKKFSAQFSVKREESGRSYTLHGDVFDDNGKKIFTKDRANLDYSQVEPALIFAFHQAFAHA